MSSARRSTRLKDVPRKSLKEEELADPEHSSEDEDVEEQRPAKRKAVSPEDAQNQDPNAEMPKPRRPRQEKQPKLPADLHGLTLFEVIAKYGPALGQAVKEWVDHYTESTEHRREAAAELLTVLVRAAGCDEDLTPEDVDSGDMDELVQQLTDKVIQEGGADPFRCRTFRNFSAGFCALWDKALRGLYAADKLFDEYLLDRLTSLVTALNTSVVRSFRFAATLAASQLISTWIGISASITQARERAGQQLAAEEKKKGAGKAGAERVAKLRRTQDQCHRRVTDLKNYTKALFDGVFAHRFRDVAPEIREVVISGIGNWVAEDPDAFLIDYYLKYLAWALSDRHEAVRLAAVRSIHRLYTSEDNRPRLQDFTDRFTTRFLELMYDVSIDVAVGGLGLLQQLVKAALLKPKDVSDVYKLLAEDSAPLRHAAAALTVLLLEEQGAEVLQQASPTGKGGAGGGKKARSKPAEQHSKEEMQLAGLLVVMGRLALQEDGDLAAAEHRRSLLSQSEAATPLGPGLVEQLVEALAPHTPVLTDINMLVAALGDEAAGLERGKLATAHLAALLAAALHRGAVMANHPGLAGRGRGRAGGAGGSGGAFTREMHTEATALLMEQLLPLLRKHQGETHVEACLMAVLRDLQLELFVLKKAAASFKALLQQAANVLGQTTEGLVMAEAAASLVHCAKAGPSELQDTAQLVLRNCVTTAAAKLQAASTAVRKLRAAALEEGITDLEGEAPQDAPDALISLHSSLRRCQVLLQAGAKDLASSKQLHSTCTTLLQDHLQGRDLGTRLLAQLLRVSQLLLLWQLQAAMVSGASADISAYTDARGMVLRVLDVMLDPSVPLEAPSAAVRLKPGHKEDLQELAFKLLTDLVLVAGSPRWDAGPLAAARLKLSQDSTEQAWGYCRRLLELEVEPLDADDWDVDAMDGGPSDEERAAAVEVAEEELSARQVAATVLLGRLVAHRCLPAPQQQWLATQLVTLLVSGHEQVAESVREVCQAMRRSCPEALPPIYTQALVVAYETVEESGDQDEALQVFASLAQKIAGMYAGHNVSVQAITDIVRSGITYALDEAPSRLRFLPWGLHHFTNKLSAEAAEQLVVQLEEGGAGHEEEEEWSPLDLYLSRLKERAAGHRVGKGVLKAPGARSKPRGKLTFAATAAGADQDGAAGDWHTRGGRQAAGSGRKAPAGGKKLPARRRQAAKKDEDSEEDQVSEEEEAEEEEPRAAAAAAKGRGRGRPAAAAKASPRVARPPVPESDQEEGEDALMEDDLEAGASHQQQQQQQQHSGSKRPRSPAQQPAAGSRQRRGAAAGGSQAKVVTPAAARDLARLDAGTLDSSQRTASQQRRTQQQQQQQPSKGGRLTLPTPAGSSGGAAVSWRGARSSLGGRSQGRVSGGSSLNFEMPEDEEEGGRQLGSLRASLGTTQGTQDLAAGDSSQEEEQGVGPLGGLGSIEQLPGRGGGRQGRGSLRHTPAGSGPDLAASQEEEEEEADYADADADMEEEEDLDLTLADSQMPSMRIEVDEDIEEDDGVDMPQPPPRRRRRL